MNPRQQASYNSVMNAPSPMGAQPNMVEKLLPTAGSVLGGLAGTFLDPVTAGLGTVGGSAIGSALGQELENRLTGSTGSTLGAGVEGAAGGALGALGGKVIGGGAKLLGKAAGNLADRQAAGAATDAFAQDFPKAAFNNKLLQNLDVQGNRDALAGLGVNPSAENFNDVGRATSQLLNTHLGNALESSGPVDINPLQGTLAQELERFSNAVGENPDVVGKGRLTASTNHTAALRGQLNNMIQGSGFEGGGSLTGIANPADVRQLVGNLQKAAIDAKPTPDINTGVVDSTLKAKYDVLNNVANKARSLLYDRPELESAVTKLGGNTTANDVAAITEGRLTGSDAQAVADYVNQTVNEATAGNHLLEPLSRSINMHKAGQIATDFKQGVSPIRPVEAAASNEQMLSPETTVAAQLAHPKLAKIASVLNYIGNIAAKPAAAAGEKVAEAASSAPGHLPLGIPGSAGTELAAHAPSLGADNGNVNANPSILGNMGPESMGMNPYQTSGVQQQGGPSLAWAGLFAPSIVPTLQAAQRAQAAQPVLNALEQSYSNAGGAQGTGGGLLSSLSGFVPGTQAYQYNQQKLQAAAALAQATGMPLHSILAALPSLMANQQGATNEFQGVQGALGSMQTQPQFGMPSVLAGLPN